MSKPKEKCILPGLNLSEKPGKNFLLENIKKLRVMQKEAQKKIASGNQTNAWANAKKASSLKTQNYHRKNKSELDLGTDSDNTCINSRLSTPVTAMASSKPVKNQKMQTVSSEKQRTGKILNPKTTTTKTVKEIVLKKNEKARSEKSMARSLSVPSLPSESRSEVEEEDAVDCAFKLRKEMLDKLISGEKKDFVAYNTYRRYQEKPKPSKPDPIKPPPNYRMGELPKYLQASNKDAQSAQGGKGDGDETEQRPGFVLLSEEERKDHLEEFKKVYSELICKLRNLPLSSDSYSHRQKKMHLEKDLGKLEELMKLFSRERLYIKVA